MKVEYHIIFADEVQIDINKSKEWYNNQQKDLGERFVKDVKSTIKRIVKNPQLFTIKYQKVRTANCSVFPFAVHFELDEINTVIRVAAVFHFSRKPYWE